MNDYERRALDIAQSSTYLTLYARQGQQIVGIEYFGYSAEIDNLAPQATASTTFQVQSDSDFVATYLAGCVVNPANGTVQSLPYSLVQITDTGTGKTFFNQPSLMGLLFGNGGYPFVLPAPRTIAPNTNIQYTVQNLNPVGGTTFNYYFTMEGARIYYAAS